MESAITSNAVMEKFLETVKSHTSALQSSAPNAVLRSREALAALSFPTTRQEEWKYTRTARISSEAWTIQREHAVADINAWRIPDMDARVLVFVNGFYSEALSDKALGNDIAVEFELDDATTVVHEDSLFNVLNAAYATSAIRLRIPAKSTDLRPVHLLHIASGSQALAQTRVHVHAAKSSACHIAESFVATTEGKTLTNRILNVQVEENAEVHYYKLQLEGDSQFLINEDHIAVDDNARFTIHTLSIDGGWIRNGLNISLDGKNIEANLNGLYLPRRRHFVDNHTKVDHRFPHCNSNELYKGLLFDSSTGVFNGKVYVRPDAQKTNAYQSNANILMSDDAQMNSKPELEIYADDVKCSHGSTSGQMDEQALFYLKSRGLSDTNARKLLSTAFIQAVLDKIELEPIRAYAVSELIRRDLLFA